MITKKRIARENALKFFFSKEFSSDLSSQDFLKNFELETKGINYYQKLTSAPLNVYFERIESSLKSWSLDRINPIDKIIIALALKESQLLVPKKVIINEYLEISKVYGTAQSPNFINGILDSLI